MQERQRETPRHGESGEEETCTVKWQVAGAAIEEYDVHAGTKLSEFLEQRGHTDLRNKILYRNGTQVAVDKDGNIVDDCELRKGDLLSLFGEEIVKGDLV